MSDRHWNINYEQERRVIQNFIECSKLNHGKQDCNKCMHHLICNEIYTTDMCEICAVKTINNLLPTGKCVCDTCFEKHYIPKEAGKDDL